MVKVYYIGNSHRLTAKIKLNRNSRYFTVPVAQEKNPTFMLTYIEILLLLFSFTFYYHEHDTRARKFTLNNTFHSSYSGHAVHVLLFTIAATTKITYSAIVVSRPESQQPLMS